MRRWDRYAIKAEIYRRGQTLTGLARAAGLADNAVRIVLTGKKRWAAAEQAVAEFIGQPVEALFPLRRIQPRRPDSCTSRRTRQRRGARKARQPAARRMRGTRERRAA